MNRCSMPPPWDGGAGATVRICMCSMCGTQPEDPNDVTPETAQYRIFVWLAMPTVPDKNLIVIAREDDTTFGILQSRIHEVWSLRLGTSLEDRPRYTSSITFSTYPFPEVLTPDIPAAVYGDDPRAQRIVTVARRLNDLRDNWLNPPELVNKVPEVVSGFPDRLVPMDGAAADVLKQRTLTKVYNTSPARLQHAHRELNEAVAVAYGWEWPLADAEILKRLFELNRARVKS